MSHDDEDQLLRLADEYHDTVTQESTAEKDREACHGSVHALKTQLKYLGIDAEQMPNWVVMPPDDDDSMAHKYLYAAYQDLGERYTALLESQRESTKRGAMRAFLRYVMDAMVAITAVLMYRWVVFG